MKAIIPLLFLTFLTSCAIKVPFDKELKDRLSYDTDAEMRRLQFYTSGTLILDEVPASNKEFNTDANGVVYQNNSKARERIIVPANTKCIFDEFGEKDKILVRFEEGKNKTLTFDLKPNNKRYYLDIDPNQPGGPTIKYGNKTFRVDLLRSGGGSVHLLVKKNPKQARTKGRVVKGLKV